MFIDLVRKIESYLEEISQCANSADWDFAQSERLIMQEEDIAYHLEIYPYVVSDLFKDILSVKSDMIETILMFWETDYEFKRIRHQN